MALFAALRMALLVPVAPETVSTSTLFLFTISRGIFSSAGLPIVSPLLLVVAVTLVRTPSATVRVTVTVSSKPGAVAVEVVFTLAAAKAGTAPAKSSAAASRSDRYDTKRFIKASSFVY